MATIDDILHNLEGQLGKDGIAKKVKSKSRLKLFNKGSVLLAEILAEIKEREKQGIDDRLKSSLAGYLVDVLDGLFLVSEDNYSKLVRGEVSYILQDKLDYFESPFSVILKYVDGWTALAEHFTIPSMKDGTEKRWGGDDGLYQQQFMWIINLPSDESVKEIYGQLVAYRDAVFTDSQRLKNLTTDGSTHKTHGRYLSGSPIAH